MAYRLAVVLAALLVVLGLPTTDAATPSRADVARAAPADLPPRDFAAQSADRRPNIVLISTDDQGDYDLRWMPRTRRLLAREGVTFSDSVSPHPLCCPARAEILTGQFAQNNGVRTNWGTFGGFQAMNSYRDTIGPWLRRSGYRTAFVGKFLNGYRSRSRRLPGWDEWHPLLQDGGLYRYYGFSERHNDGVLFHVGAYVTDVLARTSARVLREFAGGSRPFFVWQSHVAPHDACAQDGEGSCWEPPVPAKRHEGVLEGARPPSFADPAFLERDISDKPAYLQGLDGSGARREPIRERFVRRIQSLQSVDEAVARTIRVLRDTGELRDTVVVFTSDNGYLLGEHRWLGKLVPYEQAQQVPLLMRGPGIPRGVTRPATVATVDLAPTFLDLADVTPTVPVDGRSLLPLAQSSSAEGWGSLLIQDGPRYDERDGGRWFYRGVRTARYTYVEYPRYGTELYDRGRDPHELQNVAGSPAYRAVQRQLRRRLAALQTCAGASCRRSFGTLPRPGDPADQRAPGTAGP